MTTRPLELFTDLYELTMAEAYLESGMTEPAVFSLAVRRLPEGRDFLLAAGLEQVLGYLEALRFGPDSLDYLRSLGRFSEGLLAWLRDFRFSGEMVALPEGTAVFANEPVLEVTAPIAEAQIVETYLMNQVHLQTVLASKAARLVHAARGRPVIDFGARRMYGVDAALEGARAFSIGGVAATSNLMAGKIFGVPVTGTMAHSFVQAHGSELEAFRAFARLQPEGVLLVDTYDTLQGVRHVAELAGELGTEFRIGGVRLDSGDLGALAVEARGILDAAGLRRVKIYASGGLDEYAIDRLLGGGAPIDGFGVGTAMGVPADHPSLDIAYKLCAYAGEGRLKLSPGKPILPGSKQVFRRTEHGIAAGDTIARAHERLAGRALLRPVMRDGRRLRDASPALKEIRAYAAAEIAALPPRLRALEPAVPAYDVRVSEALAAYQAETRARLARENATGAPGRSPATSP